MKSKESLKILLVQIRKDQKMIPAERNEFVTFSGLSDDQLTTLDVFRNPDFIPDLIDDYDALFIGGLSDDHSDQIALPESFNPFLDNLNRLMLRALDKKVPSLLSCGGFMLASLLLGARVITDPDQSEIGVVRIFLTNDGRKDPLFYELPACFDAVSGHFKNTVDLPENCIHLAYSSRCHVHGFRVKQAPFYAFQFHPEITCEDLQARVMAYKDKYFDSDSEYQKFIRLNCDTSAANSILEKFIKIVISH